ncbi:50S ribosomal protein L9 [Breoghania sp. L-A4]|uniref:50S ribosomal protein L9 n=1 Tax=Breoghania sp. L-A4 TaxID=2304600 RepID=UPI000E359700|nr:50S ribosomal protein L9 [Breoghania sp. L-A4]AXS40709.1 50S ribosomal protein L9 [Breoghania sp. L-A4]
MQVILLERVAKLGQMGETVRVRDGYARNFLLPQGKALRATKANNERFESQRVQLEARNLERRQEAEGVATKLDGLGITIIRSAGETGQLYGSVSTRDISENLDAAGFSVTRSQVDLSTPIKTIGVTGVIVRLHPEVEVTVNVNVARSADEAERQARGEDLTQRDHDTFEFEPEDEDEDGADGEVDLEIEASVEEEAEES